MWFISEHNKKVLILVGLKEYVNNLIDENLGELVGITLSAWVVNSLM